MRYKNNPEFQQYLSDVESLMPELSLIEIDMLKKYFKIGASPEEAVYDMLNFEIDNRNKVSNKRISVKLNITDIRRHKSTFEFEEY